jgi:hypothetical protein
MHIFMVYGVDPLVEEAVNKEDVGKEIPRGVKKKGGRISVFMSRE